MERKINFEDEVIKRKIHTAMKKSLDLTPVDFTLDLFEGHSAEIISKTTSINNDGFMSEMLGIFDNIALSMKEKNGEVIVYEVKDELFELIKNTDNKFFYRNIPHNIIFLDNDFYLKGKIVKGLCVVDDNKEKKDRFLVVGWGIDTKDYSASIVFFEINNNGYSGSKEYKKLAVEIVTILDMIDAKQDVEFFSKKIEPSRNTKRVKRGKLALHDKIIIKPKQALKQYLSEQNSFKSKFKYSHKFLVRGHYRHYVSDRYSSKLLGTKKWVKPYYKGAGKTIHKRYIVK